MRSWAYLIVVVITVLINKVIKLFLAIMHKEKLSLRVFTRSGDMPSDHSGIVSSVTTMIGLLNGFDSPVFALSFCVAILMMYDAMHVRLSAGEQGLALNRLLEKKKENTIDVHLGHEPVEVYVGCIIGVAVAFWAFVIFI